MLYQGGVQDKKKGGKLGAAMDNFHQRSVKEIQRNKNESDDKKGTAR